MTATDVRTALKAAVEDAGGQTAWAKLHGVSQPWVANFMSGEREPSPKLLRFLGLERVTSYRKVKP
jgi:DNA-binding transcriptional regulator YdaS (Cro superfamily)